MACANHDFICPDCGTIREDVPVPMSLGASHAEVYCPACDEDLQRLVRMSPIPAFNLSVFSDADARSSPHDFAKSTTQVEDPSSPTGFREVTIGSLADIRRIERESEQRERNGEGRKMVFRDYSQDHSNQFVHTLGTDPSLPAPKRYSNGTPVRVRKGDPVVSEHGSIED